MCPSIEGDGVGARKHSFHQIVIRSAKIILPDFGFAASGETEYAFSPFQFTAEMEETATQIPKGHLSLYPTKVCAVKVLCVDWVFFKHILSRKC